MNAQEREVLENFLNLLTETTKRTVDVSSNDFSSVKDFLSRVSKNRSVQGFTPSETALRAISSASS